MQEETFFRNGIMPSAVAKAFILPHWVFKF